MRFLKLMLPLFFIYLKKNLGESAYQAASASDHLTPISNDDLDVPAPCWGGKEAIKSILISS